MNCQPRCLPGGDSRRRLPTYRRSALPACPRQAPVPGGLAAATGVLIAALTIGCGGAATDVAPADLVLRGGKVVTVDGDVPGAEAVAVTDYSITAVGSDAEIEPFVGDETEVIELDGRLLIPGFIEGHGHFMGLGNAKMILDLTTARSWDEIVNMVEDAAEGAEPGEWIMGRGWHQEKWEVAPSPAVDGVPLHHGLSEVSPDNPVRLGHASGHAAFVNVMAMELAGIDSTTPDPPGGTIVKDEQGNPTGLLRETAQRLIDSAVERARADMTAADIEAENRRMVALAGEEALSKGVTSFQDAGSDFATIDFFRQLDAEGSLPVRLYVMVRFETNETMAERLPEYRIIPDGNDFLAVRAIKRQIDGALGSHGAWLLQPYEDLADSTGLVLEPVDDIERTCEIAIEHGFQVNTHAIGDRANREVLDIYERTFAANPEASDLRWRIEHAQHIDPDDIPRFAELGVIASMQAVHCTSDGPWVFRRLGDERARTGAYMWRELLDSGAVVTNGTDVPVEAIDPIAGFYASVARMTEEGPFFPDQAMTREEALYSYTMANAYAAFEERLKGSITPGKLADLVVVDRDILTIPAEQIPQARIDYTIVGGEVRYRRR